MFGLVSNLFQFNKKFTFQILNFSKYISKSRAKHLPLNTKRAGKGYKKGYGARTEGIVTSKGNFIPVKSMRTQLVVPDLTGFKLKAYVADSVKKGVTTVKPEL
mmetsp:Transcript_1519/g.1519  ORF Transcript_1519/g.1519 Transcript_1519/m.1519 type:complete len:103 (+) Transcript_1519:90-398(+)